MCRAKGADCVASAFGESMHRTIAPLVLALALGAASAAQAQSDDRAYCENLYTTWDRYLGPRGESRSGGGVDAIAAVDQCRRGNTAAGIAVLEKKLRDGLFSLPKR